VSTKHRYITHIISILLCLATIGFVAISYTTALYFLGGILAGLILIIIPRRLLIGLFIGLLIVVCLGGLFLYNLLQQSAQSAQPAGCEEEEEYQAIIEPVNISEGSFKITETVVSVKSRAILQREEKQSFSSARGLMIREVAIDSKIAGHACFNYIELKNLPRNSFYEAQGSRELEISTYLDAETIRWDQSINDDIAFAYLANPFYLFRNYLSPFIGVSNFYGPIGLLSLLSTFLLTPLLESIFIDFVKSKFNSFMERKRLQKDRLKKPSKRTSSKVDTKEIKPRKPK